MNRIELESFAKSFGLFFISLSLLASSLYYANYGKEKTVLNEQIYSQMRLCSFDLKCEQFSIDFEEINDDYLYRLLDNESEIYSYFPISKSEQFVLKFSYSIKEYEKDLHKIEIELVKEFVVVLMIIAILSILFSLYAIYPLRSALRLTKEFVRDILHDVNTPLSSLRLNASLLIKEYGQNRKLERIEQSVDKILSLQNNLRGYLDEHASADEIFDLMPLLDTRIEMVRKIYPDITFEKELYPLQLNTNRDAMDRIIDNLLTNAAKYNKENGLVYIKLQDKNLIISDTGSGIRDSSKVFKRFYTENAKGVGIGLHIVKKLCDALGITISLKSEVGEGSLFTLNFSRLTKS